jgi:hypothetical protein
MAVARQSVTDGEIPEQSGWVVIWSTVIVREQSQTL